MNQGLDQQTLAVIVWGLAILVLSWTWFPAFIAALGGTRYVSGINPEMPSLESSSREPDYSFWAEQLQPLGYEPLGTGWVRVSYAGPHWSLYSPIRLFKNSSKNAFAFMRRAPAPFLFFPGVEFLTSFGERGALRTDNNRADSPHPDDDFVSQGVVTLNIKEVEDYHLATQEALRRLGRRPDSELTPEGFFRTLEQCEAAEIRHKQGRAGTQYLFAHGLIHICVSIPAAYVLGLAHWSVALANLVLGSVLLFGENAQKRQYAQAVRAALRARMSSTASLDHARWPGKA